MKALFALGFSALVVACSSEEARAPSRPPTSPPVTTTDAGSDASATCFDTKKDKPTQPDHFLNQCNSGECSPFDNAKRIEGFKPGQPLPPLN